MLLRSEGKQKLYSLWNRRGNSKGLTLNKSMFLRQVTIPSVNQLYHHSSHLHFSCLQISFSIVFLKYRVVFKCPCALTQIPLIQFVSLTVQPELLGLRVFRMLMFVE